MGVKKLCVLQLAMIQVGLMSGAMMLPAEAQDVLQRIQARREAREEKRDSQNNQSPNNQSQLTGAPMSQTAGHEVSMVTLQTKAGAKGQQMVVTPKGFLVPLPGPGVKGEAVQIYMGSAGGYWYVDKNNQQVDLTDAVHRMQAQGAPVLAASPAPQYSPQPPVYAQPNNGLTALAAGAGAMAGAAISSDSSWNTVPYGVPVRYGVDARPYYNQGGNNVYIGSSTNVNSYHAAAINQQQDWYRQQQLAQGANYRAWQQPTANPFVAGAGIAHYGVEQGQQDARYGAAVGVGAVHYGVEQGQQDARYGAVVGAGAAHYGAEQGQQDARYGAAVGAGAAHYGAQQGQQDARYGAAAGAGAAHYGAEQGQQDARYGAAAGAGAAHRGEEQGQQDARFGAAAGAERANGGDRDGRNGFSGARQGGRRGR